MYIKNMTEPFQTNFEVWWTPKLNTIVFIILMQLLIISSLKSVSRYVSYREASIAIRTVHAAKCYDQSRLITWNFESHVNFLRGFCVDITRKYREFCVERGNRTWNSATLAWSPAWKRLTVSVKKIICRIILPVRMNIALRLEYYSTAAFREVLIFFWNARCGEILSMKDWSFSVNHDLPCFECLHQLRSDLHTPLIFAALKNNH